jgi:hypothetical protein
VTIPKSTQLFSKSPPLSLIKIFLESLLNILTAPIGIFQKFEIRILAGIVSNTLWAEFSKVRNTVADGFSYALGTVAVPADTLSHPAVDRPLPQPGPWPGGGGKASSLPPRSTVASTILAVSEVIKPCQSACVSTAVPARMRHAPKAPA